MMKGPAALNAPASPVYANYTYANGTYANVEVIQERNCTKRPTNVPTPIPGPRKGLLSFSDVTPRSHQRRWSADFCRCATSPVITVRKNLKEPEPPKRRVSLLTPQAVPRNPSKRYSCPPFAVFSTKTHPSTSSSSSSPSSNSSSCSSPPPVQTSVITGHDPLGWKLRPKSSSSSPCARANRLSLQIPLPVIHREIPTPDLTPDPSKKTKPPLKPKPTQRRHSDSSAFLRKHLPMVTLEDLRNVHLKQVPSLDKSDDVFSDGGEEEEEEDGKVPPPVPYKTAMARQIAQLMARSHQRRGRVSAGREMIYPIKTNLEHSHGTEDTRVIVSKTAGLRVDANSSGVRPTPRFPG